jgi:hypothetical protein
VNTTESAVRVTHVSNTPQTSSSCDSCANISIGMSESSFAAMIACFYTHAHTHTHIHTHTHTYTHTHTHTHTQPDADDDRNMLPGGTISDSGMYVCVCVCVCVCECVCVK